MAEVTGTTWTVYDANTLTQAEIYGEVLCDLGEKYPKIVGLSADLAKSTKIGKFGDKFPDRFFNVGIAEQNMFGIAAGLAKSGLLPFVSTMAAFTAMRSARAGAHRHLLPEPGREDHRHPRRDLLRRRGHHAPLHRGYRHHAVPSPT